MAYSINTALPTPAFGISNNITTNAIEIRNGTNTVLSVTTEGNIMTRSGAVHVDDWVTIINVMKQFIMDMSKDEDLASKYPYIRETAHRWLVDELRK